MRLIDADTLKQVFDNTVCIEPMPYAFVKQIIDNAPTVDISETISKFRNTAYQNGFTTGLNKRPQGEWGKHGECPFCSYIRKWEEDNFCGNCGARLKGGAEE